MALPVPELSVLSRCPRADRRNVVEAPVQIYQDRLGQRAPTHCRDVSGP